MPIIPDPQWDPISPSIEEEGFDIYEDEEDDDGE